MSKTLLETYQNRLARADRRNVKRTGERLDESKAYFTAQIFKNVSDYVDGRGKLNEALDNSIGTQTKDLGAFKRFVLDITEVTLPALIAPEIAKTVALDSMQGYVIYRKYTASSRKGTGTDGRMNVGTGDAFYNPANRDVLRGTLNNGKPQDKYTSRNIVLPEITLGANDTAFALRWSPIFPGSVKFTLGSTTYYDNGTGWVTCPVTAYAVMVEDGGAPHWAFFDKTSGAEVAGTDAGDIGVVLDRGTTRDAHLGDYIAANGANGFAGRTVFGSLTGNGLKGATIALEYAYENDYIPQNDIPTLGLVTEGIELRAKPRRIQIVYSQFAEFVGQKDYNFDVSKELKQQAEFQIQLEIDNEVVNAAIACGENNPAAATWYSRPAVGISLYDHYETLMDAVAVADAQIYEDTEKYMGTYILIGPKSTRFFSMNRNYKPLASQRFGIGAYVMGEILGHKVIVSNLVKNYDVYIGVKTEEAFAVIMGMYMPIMSTQMLGLPDGTMAQGFASLYDVKVVNPALVRKVTVVDGAEPTTVVVEDGE